MVIKVRNNQVSITVCEPFAGDTKTATMNFLNELCAYCEEAARHYYSEGHNCLGDQARRYSSDIYQELEKRGYYDDLYKEKKDEND